MQKNKTWYKNFFREFYKYPHFRIHEQHNDYETARRYEYDLLNKSRIDGFIKCINKALPKDLYKQYEKLNNVASGDFDLGYELVDDLTLDQIKDIVTYLKSEKVYPSYWAKDIKPIGLDELTTENFASYGPDISINCPHLVELANKYVPYVANYLGTIPIITNYSIWWTLPNANKPEEAQLFHRDADDIKFMKLFVYLTNTDIFKGPFCIVEGTHDIDYLQLVKQRHPRFKQWFFGTYRKDPIVTAAVFPEKSIKPIVGTQGTCFLADTSAIHKGCVPFNSPRLLAQVTYTVSPSAQEISKYKGNWKPKNKLYKYVNQLSM